MNADFLTAEDGELERAEQLRREKIKSLIGSVKRTAEGIRATHSSGGKRRDPSASAAPTGAAAARASDSRRPAPAPATSSGARSHRTSASSDRPSSEMNAARSSSAPRAASSSSLSSRSRAGADHHDSSGSNRAARGGQMTKGGIRAPNMVVLPLPSSRRGDAHEEEEEDLVAALDGVHLRGGARDNNHDDDYDAIGHHRDRGSAHGANRKVHERSGTMSSGSQLGSPSRNTFLNHALPPPPDYYAHGDEEEYEIIRDSARRGPPQPYSDSGRIGHTIYDDGNDEYRDHSRSAARASSATSRTTSSGQAKAAKSLRPSGDSKKPSSSTSTTNTTTSAAMSTDAGAEATAAAELRAQRAAAASARRAQLEAASMERVRVRQRQQMEEQKAREDAAVRAHFEMIEKHKRERQEAAAAAEARRESTAEMRASVKRAEAFRRFQLLLRWGWRPWLLLLNRRSDLEEEASAFMRSHLLLRYWHSLCGYCQSRRLEAYRAEVKHSKLASAHYRLHLMRSVWSAWKYSRRVQKAKAAAIAHRSSRDSVLRKSMRAWVSAFERQLRIRAHKYRSAVPVGDRCTLRHVFRLWQKYTEASREEREIEARTMATLAKVRQWM